MGWVEFCSRCELNVEGKSSIFFSGWVELFILVNSFLQSQTNKVTFFVGFGQWAELVLNDSSTLIYRHKRKDTATNLE